MSKCCQKTGIHPRKGVKSKFQRPKHTNRREQGKKSRGRLRGWLLRKRNVHRTERLFAHKAGSHTGPGNALLAADRTAAVALLRGGHLGVLFALAALDVNGRGLDDFGNWWGLSNNPEFRIGPLSLDWV